MSFVSLSKGLALESRHLEGADRPTQRLREVAICGSLAAGTVISKKLDGCRRCVVDVDVDE